MRRPTFIVAMLVTGALAAGCGTTVPSVSPQERQQLNQRVEQANRQLQDWNYCASLGLDRYEQCMISRGETP